MQGDVGGYIKFASVNVRSALVHKVLLQSCPFRLAKMLTRAVLSDAEIESSCILEKKGPGAKPLCDCEKYHSIIGKFQNFNNSN